MHQQQKPQHFALPINTTILSHFHCLYSLLFTPYSLSHSSFINTHLNTTTTHILHLQYLSDISLHQQFSLKYLTSKIEHHIHDTYHNLHFTLYTFTSLHHRINISTSCRLVLLPAESRAM